MDSKGSHFFIGLFVVAGVVGIFVIGLWLAKTDSAEKTISYEVYLEESVSGLSVGSRVAYRGLRVGYVSYIAIKPDNPQLVLVRINVQEAVQIRQGDVASLKLEGITGTSFINIEGAEQGSEVIHSDGTNPAVIPSQKSNLEQLVQGAPELINQGTLLAQRFADVFNRENREQLNSILQNINAVTTSLAAEKENISSMFGTINDAGLEFKKLGLAMNGVIIKVDTLADKLNTIAAGTNTLITDDGKQLINEWEKTAKSLKALADSANNVVESNKDSLQQFSQEGLYEFTLFLQESRILVAGLSRIVDRIESTGARFLLDQPTSEIHTD